MAVDTRTLTGGIQIRVLRRSDANRLKAAHQVNRDFLAPWEPARSDEFFTKEGHRKSVDAKLDQYEAGRLVPWVLLEGKRIIGTITLNDIVRGPFLNGHVAYWVDEEFNGRGICSTALAFAIQTAENELGLHRLQAATLCGNVASQQVLKHTGFDEIGLAPAYLKIAGRWQDHMLYQRILG